MASDHGHEDGDPARMTRIADELTAIRRRGPAELDTPTGSEQPEEYPETTALAEAYRRARGAPYRGRAAAITYLLQEAIPPYGQWGNKRRSEVLDLLYFASAEQVAKLAPETTQSAQEAASQHRARGRLLAARNVTGLDNKRFNEYQRQLLLGFAPFLVAFVADAVGTTEAQSTAHTSDASRAESVAEPAAATRRWIPQLTAILAAGLVATALVLAVGSRQTPVQTASQSGTSVTVTGYAKCWPDASKPVVGVWIVAANGGSGWASWHALPGQANVAWFSRTLPNGGSYVVHIGCGGTPQHWDLALTSTTEVLGSGYTFTCYDVPSVDDPTQARCQP